MPVIAPPAKVLALDTAEFRLLLDVGSNRFAGPLALAGPAQSSSLKASYYYKDAGFLLILLPGEGYLPRKYSLIRLAKRFRAELRRLITSCL
jgi:hypothetical protein